MCHLQGLCVRKDLLPELESNPFLSIIRVDGGLETNPFSSTIRMDGLCVRKDFAELSSILTINVFMRQSLF